MNRYLIGGCFALALASLPVDLYAGSACCPSQKPKRQAKAERVEAQKPELVFISKEKVQELQAAEKNLLIVDVLGPQSFAKRHIKGAINIPLGDVKKELSGTFAKLPKDNPIVLYCASKQCKASTKAAEMLMAAGYTRVYDYENGIAEWEDAGLPLGGASTK